MRFVLALAVFALAALQANAAAAQALYYCDTWHAYYPGVLNCPVPWRAVNPATVSPQPTPSPTPQSTAAARPSGNGVPDLGDTLDEWCKTVTFPSSIAVCSDGALRALAIERQRAYDEASARLAPEQRKALVADQKGWVASYPPACGVARDIAPSLPLAPEIKTCMAQAGRARIAYLRGYGGSPNITASQPTPAAPPVTDAPDRIGPGFDCAKASQPLAQLICSSPDLSRTDLLFNQAYQALRQQLDPAGQRQLQAEDVAFLNSVLLACGIPENGPVAGSPDCVSAQYDRKRSEWLSRLNGPAREEATRPIARHVDLQAKLQQLGFLPATAKIDGVYSAATRAAIVSWQNATGRSPTGFIGDADATVFASAAPSPGGPPGPAATRDEYLAYLQTLTRQHFDLLPLSLVGGRRGETTLAILVLSDGTIERIAVANSSGYPDIDARIEQMVTAIRRFPPLPQWSHGPSVELNLRLRFPQALENGPDSAQPAPQQAAAPAPSVSRAVPAGDEVSLIEKGGTYLVPVRVNDAITLDFMIDSGASDVLIPADVAMTLFRTKTLSSGDFLGERTYVLADGSKLPSARFTLRQLKVGSHVLLNVTASVGPATSEPLLGQSFLARFGSWTMDNGRHVLLLTEQR